MLLLLIKKNLPLFLPKNPTISFSFSFSFSSSSAASKTLNPPPKSNPIAEYLTSFCGLSSQRAATASKAISKLTSVEQASSVRHFFKHHGFNQTHVRRAISNLPRILSVDVEKTLEPNFRTLCEMGFTEGELHLLIASNPSIIVSPLAIPRLEFWQTFLRTDNKRDLVSLFTRNSGLINMNIVTGIAPKVALLKEHGLSDNNIVAVMKRGQGVIRVSIKSLEALLKRVKELGFVPKSPMFAHALSTLSCVGSGTFVEKMEFFKEFGWSEEEFLVAVQKAPYFICHSKEKVLEKMEFLVGRAGCEKSYIVSYPVLLMLSLEKRLKPRHYVIEILKSNGIVVRWGLSTVMSCSEKKFVETIILPYIEQVPKIHEIYIAACAGKIPI